MDRGTEGQRDRELDRDIDGLNPRQRRRLMVGRLLMVGLLMVGWQTSYAKAVNHKWILQQSGVEKRKVKR